MDMTLEVTIVTPEDAPLAIFGEGASGRVAELLAGAGSRGHRRPARSRRRHVVINPGPPQFEVDRVVALPELVGPARARPARRRARLHPVDEHCAVPGLGVFAAGDATDFAVKHGGLAAQQADTAAAAIAARAGLASPRRRSRPSPRDPAHRRRPAVPQRRDHRRAGLQLHHHRQTNLDARHQDRRELPDTVPGGTRAGRWSEMTRPSPERHESLGATGVVHARRSGPPRRLRDGGRLGVEFVLPLCGDLDGPWRRAFSEQIVNEAKRRDLPREAEFIEMLTVTGSAITFFLAERTSDLVTTSTNRPFAGTGQRHLAPHRTRSQQLRRCARRGATARAGSHPGCGALAAWADTHPART